MGNSAAAETAFETGSSSHSSRSVTYSLLSKAFAFPGEQFHAETRMGLWTDRLSAAIQGLPYDLPLLPALRRIPEDYDLFQSEYIRLFEVGARGAAPCPLHSGHYSRDRTRTLQELIRFYNFFGLSMTEGSMPDHASVELEFMHFLAAAQHTARDASRRQSFARAQRDFLATGLLSWWPLLAAKVKREDPLPFYQATAALTAHFFEQESRYLDDLVLKG